MDSITFKDRTRGGAIMTPYNDSFTVPFFESQMHDLDLAFDIAHSWSGSFEAL